MQIDMKIKEGVSILYPPHRFDIGCSVSFQAKIDNVLSMSDGPLLINFDSVAYVSSAILGAIFTAARVFCLEGRPVAVCSVGEGVMRVLDSLEFFDLVPVYRSEAEAIDAFSCVPGLKPRII